MRFHTSVSISRLTNQPLVGFSQCHHHGIAITTRMTRCGKKHISVDTTPGVIYERSSRTPVVISIPTERPANHISGSVPKNIDSHARAIIPNSLNGHPCTGFSCTGFRLKCGNINLGYGTLATTIGDVGELHNGNTVAVLKGLGSYCVSHLTLPAGTGASALPATEDIATHPPGWMALSQLNITTVPQSVHIR